MDFDNYYIGKIPIPKATFEEQDNFAVLVNKILSLTKEKDYLLNHAKQKLVKECESQIDQLVYKLYALTEEEIKIVEGKQG